MELFNLLAKLTLDTKEFDKELDEAQRAADSFEMPEEAELELDNSDFNQELSESEGLGEAFGSSMQDVFNGIKKALTVTGIVGLIAGIVNGLKEAIDMTAATADGIDKGSKRLNISRDAYQRWDHALRQSGSSITDLQKGVIQFNNYVAEHQPGAVVKDAAEAAGKAGDEMSQAFARLKVELKDSNGKLKTTEQLLEESLIALADFKGSKEERGALVTTLFGKGGNNLNALLDEGVEGVKALLKEADDLGLVMSDEEITNAVAYGDAVANLNAELDAIKQAFVKDIIPVLTVAVKWLTGFLTQLNPRLQTNSIYQIFDDIDRKTKKASAQVDSATLEAKALIDQLQQMGDYWKLDDQGKMTWDALAERALELFPQLSQYIDKDGHIIRGNTQDIEANIDAWARLEKQRLLSSAMDEKREAVAKQLTAAYEKGTEAALKEADADAKRAEAIEKMNAWLNERGKGYRNQDFEYKTGFRNVTAQNFDQVMDFFTDYEEADQQIVQMLQDYDELKGQAEGLQKVASDMITEAEDANSKLGEYEEKLSKVMGLTTDNIVTATDKVEEYRKELDKIPTEIQTDLVLNGISPLLPWKSHAIGSAYVPYDNYPALLHRGEQIVTAKEARKGGSEIDYTQFEDRIIDAIRAGMADANVTAVVTDREVAKGTNRFNGKEIDSGRFRP